MEMPLLTEPTKAGGTLYPLSCAQSGIWYAQMLDPASANQNIGEYVEILGALDPLCFELALRESVAETDALHLRFVQTPDGPRQFFLLERDWPLPVLDFSAEPDPRLAAESWMRDDMSKAFSLDAGPLFRYALLRLSKDNDFLWYAVNHHLINDSAGGALFVQRVAKRYGELVGGHQPPQQQLLSWSDLLQEEESYLRSASSSRDRDYWREQLAARPDAVTLSRKKPDWPTDHVRSVGWVPSDAIAELKALGAECGASLPTIFSVATAIYLHRIVGARDLVLGIPVAARIGDKLRNIVGLAANVIPLRLRIGPSDQLGDVIREAGRRAREGLRHQRYGAGLLRQDLGLKPGDPDIYGTALNFIPLEEDVYFGTHAVRKHRLGNWRVGDLLVAVYDGLDPRGFRIELTANADHYSQVELDRHRRRLLHLLCALGKANAASAVCKLELMPFSERQHILNNLSRCTWTGATATLPALFEAQATRTSDAVALVMGSATLTYGELNARANRLARALIALGVREGDLVALMLPRSFEMIIAVLAVHKSGAAYLPIDADYPLSRVAFMIRDVGAVLALTTSALSPSLPGDMPRLLVDEGRVWQQYSADNLDHPRHHGESAAARAAYVIYTSGSTGTPKGVVVTHQGILPLAATQAARLDVTQRSRVLQFAALSFDASVWEIVMALTSGAALVLAPADALGGSRLSSLLADQKITHATLPPAVLATIECRPEMALECLVVAGEACSTQLVERWSTGRRMVNAYGPTETTVCASMSKPLGAGPAPIGSPILGTRMYVLDSSLEPAPVGTVGELYIGGMSLARKYLGRPVLTAERFVADPYAATPGSRMYRTGDLARWGDDGQLEFIGRADDQVKLRSFRIEPAEIESVLQAAPMVAQAAVVVRPNRFNEPQLIAFVAAAAGAHIDTSELREFVSDRVPHHMVPDAIFVVEALPLTRNGKIDRSALATGPVSANEDDRTAALPQSPTEQALAGIWREVLRLPEVSRLDDFFQSGGHSLLATQILSRVGEVFQVQLGLRSVFQARTLAAMAAQIDLALQSDARVSPAKPIELAHADEPAPLSSSQERMWIIQSLSPENSAYNIVVSIKLIGPLDVGALNRAINELFRRHESLRSKFRLVDAQPVQEIEAWAEKDLHQVDLREHADGAWAEALRRGEALASTPFNLQSGPITRAALFQSGDCEFLFVMVLHHIAGDQWSIGVLGRELAEFYNAFHAQRPSSYRDLAVAYQDYARWQRSWLVSPEFQRQLSYWREQLVDLQQLELTTDHPRPAVQTLNGALHSVALSDLLISKLEQHARQQGSTVFMVTFAVFALLLHRLSGQDDIAIGVPIANRTQRWIEGLVGTFVNTLVLRADLSGNPAYRALLARVQAVALDAFSQADVPFERLVQELGQERDPKRPPLVQVLFNVANAPMHGVEFDELRWEPVLLNRGGAQFELSVSIDTETTKSLVVEYNKDLFEERTIDRLVAQYLRLLETAIGDPERKLADLPLLPPHQEGLLREWNATSSAFPDEKLFVRLFEEQAARRPDADAISFDGAALRYGELNARANEVAARLHALGVGPGVRAAICIERSLELLIALLGVQKSGGAYVPLDPALPPARLEYMLSNSAAKVLITSGAKNADLSVSQEIGVLDLACIDWPTTASLANFDGGASPQDPAYVIYTSGSTGKPKGVVVPHIALTNFLWSMLREPGLGPADVLIAVTTVSFDIAALELYLPLLAGGRIELASKQTATSGRALAQLLATGAASTMQATPATWRMLIEAGWKGDRNFRAICGGEALSRELADLLLGRVGELWNVYGPTETTIWSTVERVARDCDKISIGRPISNTQIHVLDRAGGVVPIGMPGEIHIGGVGVALGYQANPALSAERFVADRFSGRAGDRLYRTGDLGYWNSDGKLYHLGRMDDQVKIRGFRVELGEIESALLAHPSIARAVVSCRDIEAGDQRLVAYIVLRDGRDATTSELRKHLREQLPDYMIPSVFMLLDSIPLTANGKVDRLSLPNPFAAAAPSTKRRLPAPGTERVVADEWKKVLKIDAVYADDNFFELGGHSLLAIRVVRAVEKRTGQMLDPRNLYFQTLQQVAAKVEHARSPAGDD